MGPAARAAFGTIPAVCAVGYVEALNELAKRHPTKVIAVGRDTLRGFILKRSLPSLRVLLDRYDADALREGWATARADAAAVVAALATVSAMNSAAEAHHALAEANLAAIEWLGEALSVAREVAS